MHQTAARQRRPSPAGERASARPIALVGWIGMLESVLLAPPIASALLAMHALNPGNIRALWIASVVGFLVSGGILLGRRRVRIEAALVFLTLLVLVGLELGARLSVVAFMPERKLTLARLAARTYPETMAYRGHPFLQFTGAPAVAVVDDHFLGDLTPFNNFGFRGRGVRYEKPEGVLRIAALGGSTTASGYPAMLEDFLREELSDRCEMVEVFNFGMGSWTSAHSLVNFVLNVVDFRPDYVIVHHGWNEAVVRGLDGFRGDYANAFKSFDTPTIPDRHLIRASILYRYVRQRIKGDPPWAYLASATIREPAQEHARLINEGLNGDAWGDVSELEPFRRNIRTIVELARLRGIRPVLTTQPHSTDPDVVGAFEGTHIDQCNEIVRSLASEFAGGCIFVDLDAEMTGRFNHLFRDIGHVNGEGRRMKAQSIGRAILADVQSRGLLRAPSE